MTATFTVRITAGARADLTAIHDYITAARSRPAADELLDLLIEKAEGLRTFPRRGSIPLESTVIPVGELRQTIAGPYRVIYRIVDRAVVVVLVADGRRDMQALLAQRLLNG
ncbi:MAG: type II toxin-antitoxin system RelE/ParE family toxin [Pseudomonadota bacterium]|nr:type II toxin-antitoxin system RelE/ParE family toxin [Pseudomonadota bacterium]